MISEKFVLVVETDFARKRSILDLTFRQTFQFRQSCLQFNYDLSLRTRPRHRSSRREKSNVANATRFLPNCTTILDQRRFKYKQLPRSGDTLGDDDSEGVRCRRIVVVFSHSS